MSHNTDRSVRTLVCQYERTFGSPKPVPSRHKTTVGTADLTSLQKECTEENDEMKDNGVLLVLTQENRRGQQGPPVCLHSCVDTCFCMPESTNSVFMRADPRKKLFVCCVPLGRVGLCHSPVYCTIASTVTVLITCGVSLCAGAQSHQRPHRYAAGHDR